MLKIERAPKQTASPSCYTYILHHVILFIAEQCMKWTVSHFTDSCATAYQQVKLVATVTLSTTCYWINCTDAMSYTAYPQSRKTVVCTPNVSTVFFADDMNNSIECGLWTLHGTPDSYAMACCLPEKWTDNVFNQSTAEETNCWIIQSRNWSLY